LACVTQRNVSKFTSHPRVTCYGIYERAQTLAS